MLAFKCAEHQASDMLYRPELAQDASRSTSATIDVILTMQLASFQVRSPFVLEQMTTSEQVFPLLARLQPADTACPLFRPPASLSVSRRPSFQ